MKLARPKLCLTFLVTYMSLEQQESHKYMMIQYYILHYQESKLIREHICGKDEGRQERGHFPIVFETSHPKNSCNSLNIGFKRKGSLEIDLCHVMLSLSRQKACKQNLQGLDKTTNLSIVTSNFEITSPSFSFIWPNHLRLMRYFF